ncbi:MAG: hypothetical protein K6F99_06775, partial [Lachnospiraceae bacterium]|nr:hypothetical protein [Lachnospiraceae bacterium]
DKSPKELELAYNKLKNAFDEKHIRSIVPRLEGRFTIELLRNTAKNLSSRAFNACSVNNVSFHQRFKPLKDVIKESSLPSPVYVREYNIIQAQNAIANNAENNRAEAGFRLNALAESKLEAFRKDKLFLRYQEICDKAQAPLNGDQQNLPEEDRVRENLLSYDHKRQRDLMINSLKTYCDTYSLRNLMTQSLGKNEAEKIGKKFDYDLNRIDRLNKNERDTVLSIAISDIGFYDREALQQIDKDFVPVETMGLNNAAGNEAENNNIKNIETKESTIIKFRSQNVRESWNINKDGSIEKQQQLLSDLDYIEKELMEVDQKSLDTITDVSKIYINEQNKTNEALIKNSTSVLKGVGDTVPDAPSAEQANKIRELSNSAIHINPAHADNIAKMLDEMNKLKLFEIRNEDNYAFQKLIDDFKTVSRTAEKGSADKIHEELEKYKTTRAGMDDLFKMANDSFTNNTTISGLEMKEIKNLPAEYAKNPAVVSQLNSVFLLGNMLKKYAINNNLDYKNVVERFKADPGTFMKEVHKNNTANVSSLNAIFKNSSTGTILYDIDTKRPDNNYSNYENMRLQYEKVMECIILTDKANENKADNLVILNESIKKYEKKLIEKRRQNVKTLNNRTNNKWEAVKALTLLNKNEIDADKMLAENALNEFGFKEESFSLSKYISKNGTFDYMAMSDKLKEIFSDINMKGDMEGGCDSLSEYQVLKARVEALTELLIINGHDRGKQGFSVLENEITNIVEKFQALKKDETLDLEDIKELKQEEKDNLKQSASLYSSLKRNRTKNINNSEKALKSSLKAEEKPFISAVKAQEKLLNKATENKTKYTNKANRARNPEEMRRLQALAKAEEKKILDAKAAISKLKLDRAKKLTKDFSEGKLPEYYVKNRLAQIRNPESGFIDNMPPLFDDGKNPAYNAEKKNALKLDREKFLIAGYLKSINIGEGITAEKTEYMNESIKSLSTAHNQNVQNKQNAEQAANEQDQNQNHQQVQNNPAQVMG